MRKGLVGVGVLLAAMSFAGCGSPAEPNSPDQAVAGAPGAPGAVVGDHGYDVSPVAEPAGIVGVLRFKSPRHTMASVGSSAGLPAAMIDAGARGLAEGAVGEILRGQVDPQRFAQVIALDAPIDGMVALDEDPKRKNAHVAFAVGLTSLEGAKAAAEAEAPLTEIANGMWRMGGKDRHEPTCAIAVASGPTPARLVCGARDRDIIALGPYLTRTVTTQAAPVQDLEGELRIRPLDERFGGELRRFLPQAGFIAKSELSIGDPTFDAAVVDAAKALANELGAVITDLDKVNFGVALKGGAVEARGSLAFRGKKSWTSSTIADGALRAGAAPELFWRAPKDSHSVLFARGSDPARYAGILKVGRKLLQGALASEKIGSAADRKALADLLTLPLKKNTNTVSASGSSLGKPAGKSAQANFDAMMSSLIGWHLIGVDEGPGGMSKWLKDMVAVYNRPGFQKALKDGMGSDSKMLPIVKIRPAPPGLGRGSFAIEITVANLDAPPLGGKADRNKKVKMTMWVMVMADGDATWVGFGANKNELASRLKSVKKGTAKGKTLASRTGLSSLKSGQLTSGGFVTLAMFTKSIGATMETVLGTPAGQEAPQEVKQMLNAIKALPNRGETPILFTGKVSARQGVQSSGELVVPPGAIKDIASFATTVAKIAY